MFWGGWVTATGQKPDAWGEFTHPDPCEQKIYLQRTIATVENYTAGTTNNDSSYGNDQCNATTGTYGFAEAYAYSATQIQTYSTNTGTVSNHYSGSFSHSTSTFDNRTISCDITDQDSRNTSYTETNQYGTVTSSGALDNNGWVETDNSFNCTYYQTYHDYTGLTYSDQWICTTDSGGTNNGVSINELWGDETDTRTVRTFTQNPPFNSPPSTIGSGTTTYTLANEYPTSQMLGEAIATLPTFLPPPDYPDGYPYLFSVQATLFDYRQQCSIDKGRFNFEYDTEVGVTYTVTMAFGVFQIGCDSGFSYREVDVTESIAGDGQRHWEAHDLNPIVQDGFVAYQMDSDGIIMGGGSDLTFIALGSVTLDSTGCSCGTCAASASGAGFGSGSSPSLNDTSLKMNFALGSAQSGQSAGRLSLSANALSPSLFGTQTLGLSAPSNLVAVVTNTSDGSVRQVAAAEGLVDVASLNSYAYQMVFFPTSGIPIGYTTNVIFSTNSLIPQVTWTISNPDTTSASNRLQVVESHGSTPITNLFTWNGGSKQWEADLGNGLSRKNRTIVYDYGISETNRYETNLTINPANNQVVSQTVSKYQLYPWGMPLVQEIVGTGSAARTNSYAYYNTSPGDGSYGHLQAMTNTTGYWETYQYYSSGQLSSKTVAYQNTSLETFYDYTPWTAFGDDPSVHPLKPRTVRDYRHKTFYIYNATSTIIVECPSADDDAPFESPSLCTTNYYYAATDPHATQLKRVDHPDGTMELYTYGSNPANLTNVVLSGQPSSDRSTVVDGTKTISIYGAIGQLLSRQVVDIASGITTAEDIYSSFDANGRPGLITHLDGATDSYTYDCCNLESTTDRNGILTINGYDALKRKTSDVRLLSGSHGITNTYTYDAAGNLLSTLRTGTDGTTTSRTSTAYDSAGRVIFETNALNQVTSYSYAFDSSQHLVTTTTYPDGGVRIEKRNPDGTPYQITGSAVHGVQYDYPGDGIMETKLDASGSTTSEWVRNYVDPLNRPSSTAYAGGASGSISYNGRGQRYEEVGPDGVTTYYGYNARGKQSVVALRTDSSDSTDGVDYSGSDQITAKVEDVIHDSVLGADVRRSRTWVWPTFSANTSNLVSTTEISTDGLKSWQTTWHNGSAITSSSVTAYNYGASTCAITNIAPDNSYTVAPVSIRPTAVEHPLRFRRPSDRPDHLYLQRPFCPARQPH